ncbi:GMC family oxidoreductase N-terminal domain-containing protein [Microbacterium sp. YMB-B2]|uniref:GMC family oxidoreductase N-terminal domain-containing protein n=1 Tax=Microbacterium tenebrionis TaxID=2830665 RepID=A0A9X1S0M3_9MICO|nr:GMC oxidoreductase [Microbacterium tenebrionis]MCC2028873.1 GMC family oxidoreductase N-terminal domain-containing protein [Microbacterium tenebrionis]
MDINTASSQVWDLVIVGSGPAGAAVAAAVHGAAPDRSVLVVEAGPAMSAHPGEHLVEADEDALRVAFETLMRRARQIDYVSNAGAVLGDGDGWSPDGTGIFPAAYLGHDTAEFPGASISWNIGGMGIHWAAASPTPYGDEVPAFARADYGEDLHEAQRLLRVGSRTYSGNPFEPKILEALRAALPSPVSERRAQSMPLAGVAHARGVFARTGPRDIAPMVFDGSSDRTGLLAATLVTGVNHRRGTATGVSVRSLTTGEEREIDALAVVVAADTLRTPQLLWASGVRPEALGLYLNEHSSIDGDVVVDPRRLGLSGTAAPSSHPNEPFVGVYWSPSIGEERPTHGQMMERSDDVLGHRIGMSWYTSTDLRRENRLEFSDARRDALGMPVLIARFAYSDDDLARIERLRDVQKRAAVAIGDFTPGDSLTLAPGSSLHYTGTVRLGAHDDGTSVADPDGRVWGFTNLYVAGNGAIPTALTCNSTLMGIVLAVRTARAIAARD